MPQLFVIAVELSDYEIMYYCKQPVDRQVRQLRLTHTLNRAQIFTDECDANIMANIIMGGTSFTAAPIEVKRVQNSDEVIL